MPYAYSDLAFWVSPDREPDPALLPPPSSGIPSRLEGAGRRLNYGLLAGELLGVEVEAARRLIEDVDRLPDTIAHLFVEEDLALLIDTFNRVRAALAAAVDNDGLPVGEGGALLAAHPLVQQSDDGRLAFRSQRVDLADLRSDLALLVRFLTWAVDHGLLVAKGRMKDEG